MTPEFGLWWGGPSIDKLADRKFPVERVAPSSIVAEGLTRVEQVSGRLTHTRPEPRRPCVRRADPAACLTWSLCPHTR
jgi:hypothetical protein